MVLLPHKMDHYLKVDKSGGGGSADTGTGGSGYYGGGGGGQLMAKGTY